MAKLQDCQFIKIEINNTLVEGTAVEKDYKDWMEGYVPLGLSTAAGPDGVYFYSSSMSIPVTKETSKLYSEYLKRGEKKVRITTVHRGSHGQDSSYAIQKIVYENCKFRSLNFEMRDAMFMDIEFIYEDSIELTMNVLNADETGLDKIGPIKYKIPEKEVV